MNTNIEYGSEQFSDMIGKVFTSVVATEDTLTLENDDEKYVFYHEQDCCESVVIKDVVGDLKDLKDTPLLLAEMTWQSTTEEYADSCTWSYYKFRTIRGDVTVSWQGESNGYYSESVYRSYVDKKAQGDQDGTR
jgi:hypothetical protein